MLAICIWLLRGTLALAHPGYNLVENHEHDSGDLRTWSEVTGSFHVRGAFVMAQAGKVQIRCSDQSLVNLKLTELSQDDQNWVELRLAEIRSANVMATRELPPVTIPSGHVAHVATEIRIGIEGRLPVASDWLLLAQREEPAKRSDPTTPAPLMSQAFDPFVKSKAVATRWDEKYFYVESKGIPDHRMMVGITSWQQQVPLPQKYVGNNAWQIPLHPVVAKVPATTKNKFLRGAIALGVNGVPIFNPLNNRGDDALLFGELDEFGGHCGRGDDYHYHIAPVHLEKQIEKGQPIAFALDGYPIFGYDEPDGSKVRGLDPLNGHTDEQGNYHYHATKTYPYLNGGFHGEVTEREGQVDPQPRGEPLRPAGQPLRDAKITEFKENPPGTFTLTYDLRGKSATVTYTLAADESVKFTFVDSAGKSMSETYSPRRRGPDDRAGNGPPPPRPGGNPPPRREDGPPPRREDNSPPRPNDQPRETERPAPTNKSGNNDKAATDTPTTRNNIAKLTVTSSAIGADGMLPAEFTCDGAGISPPVEWSGAPAGTKCFAVNVWHVPGPGDIKSYWVLYNIPADVAKIPKSAKNVGKEGVNDKNRTTYDPMCSKGPGLKKYNITVYALSSEPKFANEKVTRADLLAAIKEITLAEGTLPYQYERPKVGN